MAGNALFKLLYVLFFAPADVGLSLTRALLFGLFRRGRPSPKWTLRQTLMVQLVKSFVKVQSFVRPHLQLSLQPGKEGDRFALVRLAPANLYVGPLDDPVVKPRSIGGTWSPRVPKTARTSEPESLTVCLHFHGGAYVIGTGRDADAAFIQKILRNHVGCTHVFLPQYRLADGKENRFPAQLQDALSSYVYLIHELGIPASRIVVSGDSAGGNLALSLLRYLHDYGTQLELPWPGAVLLWSPWTDITVGASHAQITANSNFSTDYLPSGFPLWGHDDYTANGHIKATDPYVSPGYNAGFHIQSPVWMQTGGREMLYNDNLRFYELFKQAGTQLEWSVFGECPHDIILIGDKLGWEKEAKEAGEQANVFIRKHLALSK